MIISVYTDGSCNNKLPTNARSGGWAFVALDEEENLIAQMSGNIVAPTTSQRAELTAALEAVSWFNRLPERQKHNLTVYSDSAYVVNCFVYEWWVGWGNRDFIGVKNIDLWTKLLDQYFDFDDDNIKFIHIRGHRGNEFNEMVDKMAGEARLLTKLYNYDGT